MLTLGPEGKEQQTHSNSMRACRLWANSGNRRQTKLSGESQKMQAVTNVQAGGQESEQGTWEQREVTDGRGGRPCETLVKCLAFSGSQFTQLLRKVPGISPEALSTLRKTLGPWGKQAMPGDSLAASHRGILMSLAVLARFNCWVTGLQKHRLGQHALGTTEVWVLRGHIPPIVNPTPWLQWRKHPGWTQTRNRVTSKLPSGMSLPGLP